MKKAIVTGANGFIGSWLCKELTANNVQVTAIVRNEKSNIINIKDLPNIKIIYCELEKIGDIIDKLNNEKHDVFFHLAWIGAGGKTRTNYSIQLMNVKYACDCAKIAKILGCKKFLAAGTITEEIAEKIVDIDIKAENIIYGICKNATHYMLDVICKNLNMDYVWMRFANIYGEYSMNGNIVEYTIVEFIRGNIPSFSKAEQFYDLLYVEDLVKAIYLIAQAKNSKSFYYIGSGNAKPLKEYLYEIKKIYDKGCDIKLGERPDDGLFYHKEWFNTDNITKDIGFKCKNSFEEGIRNTIKWIEENINYVF